MHPVDTIKTRFAGGCIARCSRNPVLTLSCSTPLSPTHARLIAQAEEEAKEKPRFSLIAIKEFFLGSGDEDDDGGFLGLYKGVIGNVVKEGPSSALYLGVYESTKTRLLASGGAPPCCCCPD